MQDYLQINKVWWNNRVASHVAGTFYDNEKFLNGDTTLKPIELTLLGDIKNKTVLHLQCHFGQDTLSLERMGAHATGVDFSDEAIKQAKKMNKQLGLDCVFICSDVYMLSAIHEYEYDIVFTSYGTINWLPDLNKWASIIAQFLKPGGKLIFVEFHPYIHMHTDGLAKLNYSYFNEGPIIEEIPGSYADNNSQVGGSDITFNHSLGEVLQALLKVGLTITHFDEYNYSPYNCFPNMKQLGSHKYVFNDVNISVPMAYSIVANKP
jgi:ubiquinone/menaquinone biosynthesis C-methylase UbiE